MRAATEAVWAERIEAWKKSGKSADEFAAGQPFKGSTLIWRASQMRQRSRATSTTEPRRRQARRPRARAATAATPVIAMAEVVRRSSSPDSAARLVIEVAGARTTVGGHGDLALVRDILRMVREQP